MKTASESFKFSFLIAIAIYLVISFTNVYLINKHKKITMKNAVENVNSNYINSLNIETTEAKQEKAISMISELPEVIKWKSSYNSENSESLGEPIIDIERIDNELYTIHVYELKDTHKATFKMYLVNVDTNEIKVTK